MILLDSLLIHDPIIFTIISCHSFQHLFMPIASKDLHLFQSLAYNFYHALALKLIILAYSKADELFVKEEPEGDYYAHQYLFHSLDSPLLLMNYQH